METAIEALREVLHLVYGYGPFLLPILIYCLPRLPVTPGQAKGRMILALAALLAVAQARYWFDHFTIQPNTFANVLRTMGRNVIFESFAAVIISVIGFIPVAILYFRKKAAWDLEASADDVSAVIENGPTEVRDAD